MHPRLRHAPGRRDAAAGRSARGAALALLLTFATIGAGRAQDTPRGFSFRFEPTRMDMRGHDPHVLTVHARNAFGDSTADRAVNLDTETGTSYRWAAGYDAGAWAVGADFLWFTTAQAAPDPTGAAEGNGDELVFEVPDRRFTSTGPTEVLYHRILEDTELGLWTLDLFGSARLARTAAGGLALRAGVRVGDFDNDYRALAGSEGTAGVRFDASSNYGRLAGPAIALVGEWGRGRVGLEGRIGQSVLLGEVELTAIRRDFTGPSTGELAYTGIERLSAFQDVAIPITEAALRVSVRLLDHVALAGGVQTSAWWDVPVPPGVVPAEGGDDALLEDTLVLLGLGGGLEISF